MKSIIQFFEESVTHYGNNILLWERSYDKYEGTTYKEARAQVSEFAAGLMSLGINKGDKIAIFSEERNGWVTGNLGILYAGAICVPLSLKLNSDELKYRIDHSEASIILTSSIYADTTKKLANECPSLKKIIYFDSLERYSDNELHFNEVRRLGLKWLQDADNNQKAKTLQDNLRAEDFASILYTNTSSHPRGIVLTHGNYITNVYQIYSRIDISQFHKTLILLPIDRSITHTCGVYAFIGKGASIAFIKKGKTPLDGLRHLPLSLKEIKPNVLISVPIFAKYFKNVIEQHVNEMGKIPEFIFRHALNISYMYYKDGWNKGTGWQRILKPIVLFFKQTLFKKARAYFGGELDFFIGGGALLDADVQKFFYAIGIPMYQSYGLSEATSIISANSQSKCHIGSSGTLVNNLSLKICDEKGEELPFGVVGEILIKGGNVMYGYWKDEDATKEVLQDGWLHTGDMGYLTIDGLLNVQGRYTSLLIADDGEKFSPEVIEEAFCTQSKYIDQCIMYNNQRSYTVGIIVPNQHNLKIYLDEKNLTADSEEGKNTVLKLIEKEIDEYKTNGKYGNMFPQRWLPVALGIIEEEFTESNGLMNSPMRMNRKAILEKHKNLIDFLYSNAARDIRNDVNIQEVEKMKLG